MHTHVIRTTTRELESTIDDYAPAPTDAVTAHHMGGRDWIVMIRHDHSDHGAHLSGHPLHRPDRDGGDHADLDAVTRYGVTLGSYETTRAIMPDGAVRSIDASCWIEDEARTWVLYLDAQRRPALLWLSRDADGGVIGDPVGLRLTPPA